MSSYLSDTLSAVSVTLYSCNLNFSFLRFQCIALACIVVSSKVEDTVSRILLCYTECLICCSDLLYPVFLQFEQEKKCAAS